MSPPSLPLRLRQNKGSTAIADYQPLHSLSMAGSGSYLHTLKIREIRQSEVCCDSSARRRAYGKYKVKYKRLDKEKNRGIFKAKKMLYINNIELKIFFKCGVYCLLWPLLRGVLPTCAGCTAYLCGVYCLLFCSSAGCTAYFYNKIFLFFCHNLAFF